MNKLEEITNNIKNTGKSITWRDIEYYCKENNLKIIENKNKYKVYIGNSIWTLHPDHGNKKNIHLRKGMINEFKKVLIKESMIT